MIRNQMYTMQKEVSDQKLHKALEEMQKAGALSRLNARLEKVKSAIPVAKRFGRDFFKIFWKVLEKTVTIYVLWIVLYTFLEYFSPELPSRVLANFGKAWQAVAELLTTSRTLNAIFAPVIALLEGVWNVLATILPFLR